MGPVRGRLTAAAMAALPAPAFASVCAALRPEWAPAHGPRGVLGETLYILGSPLGLVILALFALAMWRGWTWLSGLVALLSLGLAGLLVLGAGTATRAQAVAEGCAGPVYPVAAVLALIGAASLTRLWQRLE